MMVKRLSRIKKVTADFPSKMIHDDIITRCNDIPDALTEALKRQIDEWAEAQHNWYMRMAFGKHWTWMRKLPRWPRRLVVILWVQAVKFR